MIFWFLEDTCGTTTQHTTPENSNGGPLSAQLTALLVDVAVEISSYSSIQIGLGEGVLKGVYGGTICEVVFF